MRVRFAVLIMLIDEEFYTFCSLLRVKDTFEAKCYEWKNVLIDGTIYIYVVSF